MQEFFMEGEMSMFVSVHPLAFCRFSGQI